MLSDKALLEVESKDLKCLRESLCLAQSAIGQYSSYEENKLGHIMRIQLVLDEIDKHRPLGSNGKHGKLHTETCGCEDKPLVGLQ